MLMEKENKGLISKVIDFLAYLVSQPVQQVFKVFLSLVGFFILICGVLCVIGVFNHYWEAQYNESMSKFSPVGVGLILILIGFGMMIFAYSVIMDYNRKTKEDNNESK